MTSPAQAQQGAGNSVTIDRPVSVFGPDFPFAYDDWLAHPEGLGTVPAAMHGMEVAVIGAGVAGLVAAHELMKLGLKPVIYEAGRMGGRLRSEPFANADGVVAELGGMRFPNSATAFFHYVQMLGLETTPFPNPLTEAAGSTVIDLGGEPLYASTQEDLPTILQEVMQAWDNTLLTTGKIVEIQQAIRERDAAALKELWDPIVREWDDRTFYDFIATSEAFKKLSFKHREIFGQVGFGTGGWDSDFRNSMLEILRVVLTECDNDQQLIVGGADQMPRGLWTLPARSPAHWPAGQTLKALHGGATRPAVRAIRRATASEAAAGGWPAEQGNTASTVAGPLVVTDHYGNERLFPAVLATCHSWLLTTAITTDEELFSQASWMALDRTSYMQSSKTLVMVDRPFWKDTDPETGRDVMSMTLTDRLTRGTYLFDNGPDKPGVICLSYTWNNDALKMLPLDDDRRVELALAALGKIYPKVNIREHIIGEPLSISWESDPNFLGAFKGALPGHYRYNRRMYTHFMQQQMPAAERGIFIAGDDVSWTPGWAEGAVQTALNAVWGIVDHLGGHTHEDNPGPGDEFPAWQPIELGD